MKTYSKKNQHGRSMIEMLGVLAIVGVLSAGGIAGYSMAMQTHKTNQLIDKVQLIAQRTRMLYKGNYDSVSIDNLIKSGRIPDKQNPFGGNLIAGNVDALSFWIATYDYNIPAEACVEILTLNYGNRGVFLGFKLDSDDFYLYSNGRYPLETAAAISVCKGSDRKITWIFQ